jgi:hypothetical protein
VTAHVLLSSERQDWRTPDWFLDYVRDVAPIGLDPATSVGNTTFARRFYAPAAPILPVYGDWLGPDGLRAPWGVLPPNEQEYTNPPYGPHLSGPIEPEYPVTKKGVIVGYGRGWAEKIATSPNPGITLVPVRTETAWWRRLFYASDLVLFWSSSKHGCRISFVNPDTGKPQSGSNLASTVFYRGPLTERFARVFSPHGTLTRGGKPR